MHNISEIEKSCTNCHKIFLCKLNTSWRTPLCGMCQLEAEKARKRQRYQARKEVKQGRDSKIKKDTSAHRQQIEVCMGCQKSVEGDLYPDHQGTCYEKLPNGDLRRWHWDCYKVYCGMEERKHGI